MRRSIVMVAFCLLAEGAWADPASLVTPNCRAGTDRFARVELYFGVAHRSDEKTAWRRFLSSVVTPRFPQGLTVLNGSGQWREQNGIIDREASRIMIVLFRRDEASDLKIEAIRDAYKASFKQRSVLRVDSDVCASF